MRPVFILATFVAVLAVCVGATEAHAISLSVSPLKYDVSLTKGEKKKGFVDISNPSASRETVLLSVKAFRQVDNSGSLEFYDNVMVSGGILLDYQEVDIGPRETLHLAFVVDSTRLSPGDIFGAILASTKPEEGAPASQAVQVGTLLMISNGQPGPHHATIDDLNLSPFQVNDHISAQFTVHNIAKADSMSAFSPSIKVALWPYGEETVTGPLTFAGMSRSVEYVKRGNYVGFVKVSVSTDGSTQSRFVFVVTGYWRWLLPSLIGFLVLGSVLWVYIRPLAHRRRRAVRKSQN